MAETGKENLVEPIKRNLDPQESSELLYVLLGERNELVHQLEQALHKCAILEHSLASRVEDVAAIPPEVSNDGISLEEEEILKNIEPIPSNTVNAQIELSNLRFAEENAVLRQQLAEMKKERDALQLEAENNKKAKATAYQDMEALRAKRDEHAAELLLLREQITSLSNESDFLKEQDRIRQTQISRCEQEVEAAKKSARESESLKSEIAELKRQFEESNQLTVDFKNAIGLKEEECQKLGSELAVSKQQLAKTQEEIARLETKTKSLTDVVDSKEKQIEEIMREREELRNQLEELDGAVIVEEPSRIGDKIRRYLYSIKEDIEHAQHQIRQRAPAVPDTESGEPQNASLEAALEKIKRALDHTSEQSEEPLPFGDDESLMMVERNNDAASGVTLIRDGDPPSFPATNPASKFASHERPFQSVEPQPSFGGSPVPRLSQLPNNKTRTEVESFQITPSDYPTELEAGLKFSARTFGLQEPMIDLETPRGDGIENLLINFQHKYREMKDYISNRENVILALESENNQLREHLQRGRTDQDSVNHLNLQKLGTDPQVREYLQGLSREDIEGVVADLLNRIKQANQTDRLLAESQLSDVLMTQGSQRVSKQDPEPSSVRETQEYRESREESPVSEKPEERSKDQHLMELINQKELELESLRRHNEELQEQLATLQFASPEFVAQPANTERENANNRGSNPDVATLARLLSAETAENTRLQRELQTQTRRTQTLLAAQHTANERLQQYAAELRQLQTRMLLAERDGPSCGMSPKPADSGLYKQSTSPQKPSRNRLLEEIELCQTMRRTYSRSPKQKHTDAEHIEAEKENIQYSPRFAASSNVVSQRLKDSFGKQFLQRGLKGIHLRLVELTSRNYQLRTQEGQQVHRDLSMKIFQVGKMVKVLMESLEHYSPAQNEISRRSREPTIRTSGGSKQPNSMKLAPVNQQDEDSSNQVSYYHSPRGENTRIADYSPSEHKPRNSSRLNAKRDQQKLAKSRGSPQPSTDKQQQKMPDAETPENALIVAFKNLEILGQRAKGLVGEYAKIDDNTAKILAFLTSSPSPAPSSTTSRYSRFLSSTSLPRVQQTLLALSTGTSALHTDLTTKTNEWTQQTKTAVNKLRDLVLGRRELLQRLLAEDRLEVGYGCVARETA